MYNPDFFDSQFLPSIFEYFNKTKLDEDGNPKPVFISQKQFNIIAKNSTQTRPDYYEYYWENLDVICEQRKSKKGDYYYTVNFVDNFMDNHRNSAEAVLNHLLLLREKKSPKLKEYAEEYFKAYSGLIRITELDMENEDGIVLEHAKELNKFYVQIMLSIRKFKMEE